MGCLAAEIAPCPGNSYDDTPIDARCAQQSGFDLEQLVSVFPGQFAKDVGLSMSFEHGQRFARYALAAHTCRCRIVILADAAAVTILTGTIAAKHEFVLMARKEVRREFRIARQCVVA